MITKLPGPRVKTRSGVPSSAPSRAQRRRQNERATMRGSRRCAVLLMMAATAVTPSRLLAQPAPATQPATSAPTPPVRPGATTQPFNTNIRIPSSTRPATTQITLQYKDAPLDPVLNSLSEAAGFIIIKAPRASIDGRVTITAKHDVSPTEAVKLLNTAMKDQGLTIIQ